MSHTYRSYVPAAGSRRKRRQSSGANFSASLAAVVLAVLATALLSAPAARHRVLFRAGRRPEILDRGNQVLWFLAPLRLRGD